MCRKYQDDFVFSVRFLLYVSTQIIKPSTHEFLFSVISIPGGQMKHATVQLELGKRFPNASVIVLGLGTNDILRREKNFENVIEEDLMKLISVTRKVYPAVEVSKTTVTLKLLHYSNSFAKFILNFFLCFYNLL